MFAVGAHSQARLGAGLYAPIAFPGEPANGAQTIPLRKAAPRCRSKYEDTHDQASGYKTPRQISAEA